MLIGELAKQTGCDAETIRYYEREGLLRKPSRTASGYRSYTGEHHGQLNFVLHCRTLGMTLAEIRTLQDFQANPGFACNDVNVLLDQHISRVKQQIEALHLLEKQLVALRNRCRDNLTVGECGILKTLASTSAGDRCACDQAA
ncbi:mercuric resistance operon regulatory protein [mine drainage metagenome]|uniref:Mercuric resistance operon regulatory protein n=1 Tax=mine drainage metagenome TaxID=410659 RepID=A0A1J5S1I3_9ZZZZ